MLNILKMNLQLRNVDVIGQFSCYGSETKHNANVAAGEIPALKNSEFGETMYALQLFEKNPNDPYFDQFTAEEREIIANVVRYNIRDFDYDKVQLEGTYQEGTVELDQKGMTILIAKLTAILRLANSMDRSHRGKLADCRMSIREGELVITTGYEGDIALEAMSFEQKADFFEEIYGIRPVLRQKRRI